MNKVILFLIIFVALISVGLTYQKLVIKKDFPVFLHIPCADDDAQCFVLEEEKFYKLYRNGDNFDKCIKKEGCDPYVCDENEKYCEKIMCTQESIEEGEACSE